VILTEDIQPLTEFKRNTAGIVKKMKKTGRPLVLTVNGKAELVVQDAKTYEELRGRLDRLDAIEAIRQGLKDAEEGRIHDARTALERLGKKLGLHHQNH
jgi:prevent-host-death family protein